MQYGSKKFVAAARKEELQKAKHINIDNFFKIDGIADLYI